MIDKKKIYDKSNKKCSICNKEIFVNDNYIATVTKRRNNVIAHTKCLIKKGK